MYDRLCRSYIAPYGTRIRLQENQELLDALGCLKGRKRMRKKIISRA
jgi:hypothetical protein